MQNLLRGNLGDLSQPAPGQLEHAANDAVGDAGAGVFAEFARTQVGPQRRIIHRVSGRAMLKRLLQLLDDFRMTALRHGTPGSRAADAIANRISIGTLLEFFLAVVD